MAEVQRMTTLYSPQEDRVELVASLDNGQTLELWFTLRLLQRLVPVLCNWVQQQQVALEDHAQIVNSFAQQAAREALPQEAPVERATVETGQAALRWLVRFVDVNSSSNTVRLLFRPQESGQEVGLTLAALPLRQWLNILHDAYRQGDWPLQVWPDWMQAAPLVETPRRLMH